MKKIPVICYKVITPVIYNKGKAYETQEDEFLACYGYLTREETEKEIARLNTDAEAKRIFCEEGRLNAENIAYFFYHEQEPFDTRGD
jgi:hypothetical protein